MSAPLHPAYRFATEAQWQACHFAGADRRTALSRAGLSPFAPFALPPETLWMGAAYAPTIGDSSELIWLDETGALLRLPSGHEVALGTFHPASLATARRLVAGIETLWALGVDGMVQAYDSQTLARLFQADLADHFAIDIASDAGDGVYVLTRADGRHNVIHLGCAGTVEHHIPLADVSAATELAYFGLLNSIAVLGSDSARLSFFDATSGQLKRSIPVSALRTCFDATTIGSDSCSRLFIAGKDGDARGDKHQVLIVDGEGNLLGVVPASQRITGVAATRAQLFLASDQGMLRFDPTSTVPRGAGEITALVVTPHLRSSATGPQQWIRVEAKVDLPPGCSIHISHATAHDEEAGAKAEYALSDPSLSQAERIAEWRRHVERQTYAYHGDPRQTGPAVLSAPLHDVRDGSIWIEVALIAAPGGRLPVLSELAILYPGTTLVEHLPAIYRTGELENGDFTRALVGLLEASTQNLDQAIGGLGRNIHPETADSEWLDYVASWLGLPWDEALSLEQKRRIVGRAAAIAEGYSTRIGLEALLECLMPDRSRRFRIVDMTADHGLAMIAGKECEGSRLPAILAGLPATATELGSKAILGKARLPCSDSESESARLVGHVRVDIIATAEEREAWLPWLPRLVDLMLPAAVQAQIRWLGVGEVRAGRLDEGTKLEPAPTARLGSDAVISAARLGGRARTTLPIKLTKNSTLQ